MGRVCGCEECLAAEPEAAPDEERHPNVLRLACTLPSLRILVLSAPNDDAFSAREFLLTLGRDLAAGVGVGVFLREGWELGWSDFGESSVEAIAL